MKDSPRLKAQRAFVERTLGDSIICHKCRATLESISRDCIADLADPCPGFDAIENARKQFDREHPIHIPKEAPCD